MRLLALWTVIAATAGAANFDVVVYGGTPGGVAAAIAAARQGRSVALIEYHKHIGGMTTSGLGKSDIETREAIGGLFREFTGKVHQHYMEHYGANSENAKLSREGYYYEPSVALRIMNRMVADEANLKLYTNHRLEEVIRQANRVVGIRVRNRAGGALHEFRGRIFIDGSYEGDLAAYAGARYRLGREGRADFNELHAGVIYQDYETRTFLAGSTGEADKRITAYTYRLCLSSDPANSRVLTEPPPDYDRTRYLGYIDDWKAGRMGPPKVHKEGVGYFGPTFNTAIRALSIAELPNKKTDVNMNPRPLGFPFAEENYGYPEGSWEERERIATRIRNITLGLVYFLQNDEAIPAEHRQIARRYHLAKDEFTDNGNFPFQLYVREARRLAGVYTLTENDTIVGPGLGRTKVHEDSIAAGEFPVDSFPARKREKGHDVALEGYIFMLDQLTRPYQIPYRIMVPETVDGLLVPVAASTTHVAFSTVRLEPTWMALGQAAGVAAHLAIAAGVEPRAVNMDQLQREILRRGQVITYFKDIDQKDPAYAALQYFGTKGFFPDYFARSHEVLDLETASKWWRIATGTKPPTEARRFTRQTLREWIPSAGGGTGETVTRGEFCAALYARGIRTAN
ncbi:MAG: FAD-dependent oxidoreductase [Bryobacterales bacterium]|nr:FAD-dependent oxidoreductase [Bryobacterales bacterium]